MTPALALAPKYIYPTTLATLTHSYPRIGRYARALVRYLPMGTPQGTPYGAAPAAPGDRGLFAFSPCLTHKVTSLSKKWTRLFTPHPPTHKTCKATGLPPNQDTMPQRASAQRGGRGASISC